MGLLSTSHDLKRSESRVFQIVKGHDYNQESSLTSYPNCVESLNQESCVSSHSDCDESQVMRCDSTLAHESTPSPLVCVILQFIVPWYGVTDNRIIIVIYIKIIDNLMDDDSHLNTHMTDI